jgi:peptidoglycan/LPS O-acetylase OafA/YrhL
VKSPNRFIAGDPLRAVAALSVLTYHMAFGIAALYVAGGNRTDRFENAYGPAGRILENLDLGLYVFFVLSGYLLARPFLRSLVLDEKLPHAVTYLKNRALRIVPAYWFVLTLTLLRHGAVGSSPDEVLAMYGFAQVYDPGPVTGLMVQAWTLDVEVAFYLVLPIAAVLVAWAVRRRFTPFGRLWTILVLLGVAFAGSVALRAVGPQTLQFDRLLPTMIFAFIPGVSLAAIELFGRVRGSEQRGPAWLQVGRRGPVVAGALLVLALLLCVGYAVGGTISFAALGPGALVAAPLVLQWSRGRCWRVLDNPVMQWLGVRSYSIYLVHFAIGVELIPVVDGMGSAWAAFLALMALATPLSIVAAALVYRFVERPFLTRRASWKRERPAVPVRSAA